jgi:hypothetical protein
VGTDVKYHRGGKASEEGMPKAHGNPEPRSLGSSGDPMLMTIPRAARRAGIGVRQLRRAVRLEDVEAVMIGNWPRVRWDSVVRWIGSQRVRATEDVKQKVAEAVQRRRSRQSGKEDE